MSEYLIKIFSDWSACCHYDTKLINSEDPADCRVTQKTFDLEVFRLQKGGLTVSYKALACKQRIKSCNARVWLAETL
jgi:hypothetical protein